MLYQGLEGVYETVGVYYFQYMYIDLFLSLFFERHRSVSSWAYLMVVRLQQGNYSIQRVYFGD
jgi:hypothetical protein